MDPRMNEAVKWISQCDILDKVICENLEKQLKWKTYKIIEMYREYTYNE